MSRLTRDGTAEPVSRDQILRHARGQGNVHFPCSADHEQDWQPYPVDPYSAICDDHTYIHTYIVLRPFEFRCCGQERGNDIDTMSGEVLLHWVRVLPCVPQEQLHVFSLVTSCKYPFPYQVSMWECSILELPVVYCRSPFVVTRKHKKM